LKLYLLTLPGLEVRSDWRAVHDRLLDDFPEIEQVLPTTMASTLLLVYEGRAQVDGWVDSIGAALLGTRLRDRRRTAVSAKAVLHS
jgi:hypothetical protein